MEYRTIDKSDWTRGPWDDEPDKKQVRRDHNISAFWHVALKGMHGVDYLSKITDEEIEKMGVTRRMLQWWCDQPVNGDAA